MRLGFLIYGRLAQNSGGYLYDRKLVTHLRRRGHRVEIISLPWRSYLAHLTDNFSREQLSKIAKFKLDVLIQDELNHPSLFWLNRRLRAEVSTPIISLVHHLRSSEEHPAFFKPIYQEIERSYLNSVDGFIFNSITTKKAVFDLLDGSKPSIVAQPGRDRLAPRITPTEIRRRAHQPRPLQVLFLGNLTRRKAPHLLLEAAAGLDRATIQLTFAGSVQVEPAYASGLRAQAQRLGLAPWVDFLGFLDDKTLRWRLRDSQVLAVPSSYEGFGISYLEGMGFGLPAIGARAGAAPELISHGRSGFLIDVGNAHQLAGFLKRLNADRNLLAKLGVQARSQWAKHPSWQQSLARIEAFLSSYNFTSPRFA